jgi:hypothetical protein
MEQASNRLKIKLKDLEIQEKTIRLNCESKMLSFLPWYCLDETNMKDQLNEMKKLALQCSKELQQIEKQRTAEIKKHYEIMIEKQKSLYFSARADEENLYNELRDYKDAIKRIHYIINDILWNYPNFDDVNKYKKLEEVMHVLDYFIESEEQND